MRTIRVDIVSAETALFSGEAKLVVVPAVMGELGLLPGHAPLLTRLQPGELRVRPLEGEEMLLYVSGGFLEVQPQVITVLADVALRADDIDEAAALEAKERAEYHRRRAAKAMAEGLAVFDYAEAKAELARATAQLKALDDLHKQRRQKRRC